MQNLLNSWPLKIAVAVSSVALLSLIYARRRRPWKAVGKLSHLYIYPLKSGRFRELESAECTPLGLRVSVGDGLLTLRDRVFSIYLEEQMEFVTARKYPTLIFIVLEPKSKNSVTLSHPDCNSIDVVIPDQNFNGKTVTMWRNEKLQIADCGDEVAQWLSQLVLGSEKGLRMAYWPEKETWRRDALGVRPEEIYVFKKFTNQFTGAYSDLASYLLINQSSVDDLNTKIENAVKSEALDYRPNFIIEGALPYEEDKWDRIKIGDAEFTNFRPCTRCIFTTIDHKTGEKHPENEPLRTLRTYRTMKMLGEPRVEGTIPVLGIFLGLEKAGTIRAGDTIYAS